MTDVSTLLNPRIAWEFLQQRLSEAELDGFIAAHFLSRYEDENHSAHLSQKLTSLQEASELTRQNTALLGLSLERGWVLPSSQAVAQFVAGVERLERLQPGLGITLHESFKLLFGVAIGMTTKEVAEARPDLKTRITQIVEQYQRKEQSSLRLYILSSLLYLSLRPDKREQLAREVAYYMLHRGTETLSSGDIIVASWLLRRDIFILREFATDFGKLQDIRSKLLPKILLVDHMDDVFDACFLHLTYVDLVRDVSNGHMLSQDALSVVLRALDGFSEIARRLRTRRKGKSPFMIEDEYDVQDLLYAILKPHIPDLSDEEWTEKDATRAKRIDFVSSSARLGIEAKIIRNTDHAKDISEELKIDIESYYIHPSCDTLVFFIYDPKNLLVDPGQHETQLSGPRVIKGRHMEVIVRIRPH
jgi:hypothetical protein